jgi:predicted acyl esterase
VRAIRGLRAIVLFAAVALPFPEGVRGDDPAPPAPPPAAPSTPPPDSHAWRVEDRDVAIPVRDGTSLAANVLRPKIPGRYPAIVIQTPFLGPGDATLSLPVLDR